MKKIKLNNKEISQISGGNETLAILMDFDLDNPCAIAEVGRLRFLFNTNKNHHIKSIIKAGKCITGNILFSINTVEVDYPEFLKTYNPDTVYKCYSLPRRIFYKLLK